MIKKVVLIPNKTKDKDLKVTKAVAEKLYGLGISLYASKEYLNREVSFVQELDEGISDIDLIVVIGGDGSVIDAAYYAVKNDIPLLGVNLGRVGYLAEVDADGLDVLDLLNDESCLVKEKMLLGIDMYQDGNSEKLHKFAVNDVVISRSGSLGISGIKIEDSVGNSMKYRADGVILATPQGSTAYSLSAGGPVLAHDVEGIVVTAVAPHSFFDRSVVFNANEKIKVTNIGDEPLTVSVDGRSFGEILPSESCFVAKETKQIKMIEFTRNTMFKNLFKKLRIWEGND